MAAAAHVFQVIRRIDPRVAAIRIPTTGLVEIARYLDDRKGQAKEDNRIFGR
jgi:hypothetical protein